MGPVTDNDADWPPTMTIITGRWLADRLSTPHTNRLAGQDFALNLLAKRRLCNTVGGGIERTVEDCVVSAARSRAATTANLARSSQALVLSALFMICPNGRLSG